MYFAHQSLRKRGRMKFTIKNVTLGILIGLAIAAIIGATALFSNKIEFTNSDKSKITSEFIGNKIQEISELATFQHHYRKSANYQNFKKIFNYLPNWRINYSVKDFTLIYEGDVKIGYDLKDIKVNIDGIKKNIEITLPEPKILSHSINFESINVISENKGWFNEIKFEDFKQFFIEEQKTYEKQNLDMLKEHARKQAERIILFYLSAAINIEETPADTVALPQESLFMSKFHHDSGYKINIR